MSDPKEDDVLPIVDEDGQPRRTVLIVDDAPMFREMETVFIGRTMQIVTAKDGTDAFEIAQSLHPDLVLADLHMRHLDGDELCRRFRADPDLRRTPVVIITSGRTGEEHERAVRAGADDVVEKPLNRVSLLHVVNRLVRRTVRGLERVPLETDVRLRAGTTETWGFSRNVSRGGMFVEVDEAWEPDTELDLEFQVVEKNAWLQPTARVVWRRPAIDDQRPGMGLQFLKLDRDAARCLEEYVYELAPPREDGAEAAKRRRSS